MKVSMGKHSVAAWLLSTAWVLLLVPSHAAADVITAATAEPRVAVQNGLLSKATGFICTFTAVGNEKNGSTQTPNPCVIQPVAKDPLKPLPKIKGVDGTLKNKFVFDEVSRTWSVQNDNRVNITWPETGGLGTASGDWQSRYSKASSGDVTVENFSSVQTLKADAAPHFPGSKEGAKQEVPKNVQVAAEVRDPFTFTFSTSGLLTLTFDLGSETPALDPKGNPIPTLLVRSSETNGWNHAGFGVELSGPLTLDGHSFEGKLFDLVLDSTGVVMSKSDIAVTFLPGPKWALDAATISSFEAYVRNSLMPWDGGFGIAPGSILPLFGGSSPLVPLAFAVAPGTVNLETTVDVEAFAVPEPSTSLLLVVGLTALLGGARIRALSLAGRGPAE
jgi:hypothetical protein